jgi:hypothetical protein
MGRLGPLLGAVVALGLLAAGSRPPPPTERSGTGRAIARELSARVLAAEARLSAGTPPNPAGLPADCVPNGAGPPGSPYQLGFVAEVGPGSLVAGPVAVNGITAKVCGIATVVEGRGPCAVTAEVTVPPDGQKFGPLNATITELPGLSPQIPFTPDAKGLTSGLGCGSSANGLSVTAVANVGGHAGLFGLSCGLDLTIDLTATITGPIDNGLDLSGTFRSNSFGIPAVSPSPSCPGGVTTNLNSIVGLPLPPGKAVLDLPFKAAVYVPQPG